MHKLLIRRNFAITHIIRAVTPSRRGIMAGKQRFKSVVSPQTSPHPKAGREIPIKPILTQSGKPVPLIDIGANLTSKNFPPNDLANILRRASQSGLTHIILTGTSYKGSKEVLEMCAKYDGTNDINLRCT